MSIRKTPRDSLYMMIRPRPFPKAAETPLFRAEQTAARHDANYVIETNGLTKTYGSKDAVKDINIHVREGEIYGLIGRNGAGKTTIMRMLSGLSSPTKGSYSIFGKTGADLGPEKKNIGVLIENPGLYPNLSACENLKIKCIGMGVPH